MDQVGLLLSPMIFYMEELRILSLQENTILVTNFSDQNFLVTIVTNLDTNLQN